MDKRRSSPGRRKGTVLAETLWRERFARISAVEGIVLTRGMEKRAAEFERQGLSAEERRRRIIRVHRKD
jgi:hypothetical protein